MIDFLLVDCLVGRLVEIRMQILVYYLVRALNVHFLKANLPVTAEKLENWSTLCIETFTFLTYVILYGLPSGPELRS